MGQQLSVRKKRQRRSANLNRRKAALQARLKK